MSLTGRAASSAPRLVAIALVAVASVSLVGCGASAPRTGGTSAVVPGLRGILKRHSVTALRIAARGCSTAVSDGPMLSSPRPAFVRAGPAPFGVASVPGGHDAFVVTGPAVDVMSETGGVLRKLHTIGLGHRVGLGATVTPDGRYLLVASGSGAIVLSVARAQAGDADAVLGTLGDGAPAPSVRSQRAGDRTAARRSRRTAVPRPPGSGAIEVASSRDGRFAFVSLEDSQQIAVYRLAGALADHFRDSSYVGAIPTGVAPVGLAVSPDGRWLYATSELESGSSRQGSLEVIAIATAEHDPGRAVVARVDAHCAPVRVAVSPDGSVVWVTARESDQLLAFSAAKLRRSPAEALVAVVRVGEAPVGLALVDGDRDVIVADSDRFETPGVASGLTVVSTAAALAHRPAVVGTLRAGIFPRDMTVSGGGSTLIVANYLSATVETVPLQQLR